MFSFTPSMITFMKKKEEKKKFTHNLDINVVPPLALRSGSPFVLTKIDMWDFSNGESLATGVPSNMRDMAKPKT